MSNLALFLLVVFILAILVLSLRTLRVSAMRRKRERYMDKHAQAGADMRRMLPEGHPDAVWDALNGAWVESDDAFRRRLIAKASGR